MLLEVAKFVWQVALRKEKQDSLRPCTKHDNINSQGAANSVVFCIFVGENMNLHVGFLVQVRLTVVNVRC
jgi:hypothetical protein